VCKFALAVAMEAVKRMTRPYPLRVPDGVLQLEELRGYEERTDKSTVLRQWLYAAALVRLSWHMHRVMAPMCWASCLEHDHASHPSRETRWRHVVLQRAIGVGWRANWRSARGCAAGITPADTPYGSG